MVIPSSGILQMQWEKKTKRGIPAETGPSRLLGHVAVDGLWPCRIWSSNVARTVEHGP